MEANSTLTSQTIESQANATKNIPLTFKKGLWYGILFLLLQVAIIIPIAIAGFAIYGKDNQASANNFIIGLGLPIAFIGCTWFFYKKRGLINTAFQWNTSFIKLIPLMVLLIFGLSYIVGETMSND